MHDVGRMDLAPAVALYAASVILAVVASGGRFRPLVAILAGIGALTCGLLVPAEHVFVRFFVAMIGFSLLMRILDLRLDRRPWSVRMRLWLCTAVVDVREAEPMPRRLDGWSLVAVVLYAGLAVFGWWVSHGAAEHLAAPARWALRWGGGVVLIYGIADAACGLAVLAHGLGGHRIPAQHHAPILATSVGRFWSRHYNLNVSAWLHRHFHRPLREVGRPRLGLITAFAASTVLHVWIAWVPLDAPMAGAMGAFFIIQGLAVVIERSWSGFARLPIPLRRAWTLGWVLLSSPLFVEPFLRILEG